MSASTTRNRRRILIRAILLVAASRIIILAAALAMLAGLCVLSLSGYVKHRSAERIISAREAAALDADCIMVLGAGVNDEGWPRLLLRDRLNTGIELYKLGASDRLLMTGDHGRVEYDEVNAMKDYAELYNVAPEDIFTDHAGFSTYESMYRARDIFEVEKLVIVTQEYHLYRALYIAESLGLEAYGVICDPGEYHGQIWLDSREHLARAKDFFWCIVRPSPTYLGEVIPISGSGEATIG